MNKISVKDLKVSYGKFPALKDISLEVEANEILAITGPTGSGKTTLLQTLNRLIDLKYEALVKGEVLLDGKNIYEDEDVITLRRRVGMVFALPTPLPATIFENIAFGPRLMGIKNRAELSWIVERSLKEGILWDEVKERLNDSALCLSGGQQQRLCIARLLAVKPEVILLDEPCSGLDPISTLRIEELMRELKKRFTIILVTHNVMQAARVADHTAFFLMGELIEFGVTNAIFTAPKDKRTEGYIRGRFG